jgi:hypothetical protein
LEILGGPGSWNFGSLSPIAPCDQPQLLGNREAGDELEGLAANDRSLVEGAGLLVTPPDTRSNMQHIYVPRQAIQVLQASA